MVKPMNTPKETTMSRQPGMSPRDTTMSRHMGMSPQGGGHLYMQTNETQNAVIHFRRHPDGTITELDRTYHWWLRFRVVQTNQQRGKRAQRFRGCE
jgi:hypothetical protein